MTNLLIREWLNGGLIPLNACIIFVFSHSLYVSWRKYGRGWTSQPGVQSACALWWIFVADLIRSCLAWSILHAQNHDRPIIYFGHTPTLLYIASGGIAALATFRLIYTLGPADWGHKGWLAALALAVTFMGALSLIN